MRTASRSKLPPPPPSPLLLQTSRLAVAAICRAKPVAVHAAPIASFAVSPRTFHRAPLFLSLRSFSTVRETPPPQPFASSAAAIEHAAAVAQGLTGGPLPLPLPPHPLPSARPSPPDPDPASDPRDDVRRVVVLAPSTSSADALNLLRALKKEAAGPSADPSLTAFEETRHPDVRINGYNFSSQVARCNIITSGGVSQGGRSPLQLSYYRSWPFLDFARARVWDRCGGARIAILIVDASSGGLDPLMHSEILSASPRDWRWIVFLEHADRAPPHKLAEIEEDARTLLNKFGFASCSVVRGSTSIALSPSKPSTAAEIELGSPSMRKLLSAIDIAAQSRSPHDSARGFVSAVRSVVPLLSSSGPVGSPNPRSLVLTPPRSSPSFFLRHADRLSVGDACAWLSPAGVSWRSDVLAIRSESDGSLEITVGGSHATLDPIPGPDPTSFASAAGCYLQSSRAVGVECAHTFEAEVYMLSRAEGGRFPPFEHQSRAFVRFGSLPAIAAASTAASTETDSSDPLPPAFEGVVQILSRDPSDRRIARHSAVDRPPDTALVAGHNLRVRLMLRRDAVVSPDMTFALVGSALGVRVLAVGAVLRPLSRLGPGVVAPLPPFPLRSRLGSWLYTVVGVLYAWVGWWLGPLLIGVGVVAEGMQILFYLGVAAVIVYLSVQEERWKEERQQRKAAEEKRRKQAGWWSRLWGGKDAAAANIATAAAATPTSSASPSHASDPTSDSSPDKPLSETLAAVATAWLERQPREDETAAEAERKAQAAAQSESTRQRR